MLYSKEIAATLGYFADSLLYSFATPTAQT